ncbi:MAG: hypothetical protein ACRAUW_07170, partial [Aeromonas sp.]|uniref:hypothetical protein n=1 Tax=Aeromonas sp. TaxID=647 RepID=UPI003D6C60BF
EPSISSIQAASIWETTPLLGHSETGLIIAGAHVGGPEEILFAPVYQQVVGVELVEVIPGNGTHTFPLFMGTPASGPTPFLMTCQKLTPFGNKDAGMRINTLPKSRGCCLQTIVITQYSFEEFINELKVYALLRSTSWLSQQKAT